MPHLPPLRPVVGLLDQWPHLGHSVIAFIENKYHKSFHGIQLTWPEKSFSKFQQGP